MLLMGAAILANGTNEPAADTQPHQQLARVLPESCIFSGRFDQQKNITGLRKPLLSAGQIFFSCRYGLVWHNQQPFEESIVYTLKKRHFRVTDASGVTALQGQQHQFIAQLLLNLLSGDSQAILNDFTVHTDNYRANKSKEPAVKIELTPENRFLKKAITRLSIEKLSTENISIVILDNLNQQTAITLYDLKRFSKSGITRSSELCRQSLRTGETACEVLADPEWHSISADDL